jgi:hypothetical protein
MWSLETIWRLLDGNYALAICCNAMGCGRTVDVDVAKLCVEKSNDYPIDQVRPKST